MTGKFKIKEKILKWKYREKIAAKSENDFVKKHPVKAPEKGEEDLEEKEYMGSPIKVKISAGDYFTSSFLKLLDMIISTRIPEDIEKGKYPDAYVFPPKKDIMSERPVTSLDFASLYSSIIMAYNLSLEKIILD
ncbi:1647_t:CDS:2 [Funneliformis geosporum]|uniref:DNA-directed DNA polymerase n=1 Tax=Funneliformis geosporum TaxID=1117311 RepID=A0A9W4WYK7_9GLOM|nr:1647_t:CDS:2 [Funneliformis geosporum]